MLKKAMLTVVPISAIAAIATAHYSPVATPASSCLSDCKRCVAHVVEGQVLQTCPGGFSSGGFFCTISVNECQTEGVCTPG